LVDVANGARSIVLKVFAVSSHPVEQGRFVDTEQLPKLGYISGKPELAINRLKEVTLEERKVRETDAQSRTVWVFKCSLDEQVAAQIKAMTTTNVLKRVLIMVGDEPIVAPTIFAPVEDGRFEIECQDRSMMESLKKQLAEMARQFSNKP
jgi:preprotein translocase subunit SecD